MSHCEKITATVNPAGSMSVLSAHEVSTLHDTTQTGLYSLFRQCSLAVLSCDTELDDAQKLMDLYRDFDIAIIQEPQGMKLQLLNAPACAFVNGELITGVRENLLSVTRDILYLATKFATDTLVAKRPAHETTNLIFELLRHANTFSRAQTQDTVICWGGHSIGRTEYQYTKDVGYQLGLLRMDICTGCGPGAMKGPMKGAHIGHAKQRVTNGRFIGLTEPGIIAAESPNAIVNELLIMPDIEKRLEAFVRLAHGVIAFPGGPGTCEEILYLIGILLHPDNRELPFPFVLTGPASSKEYFEQIDQFVGKTLGKQAQNLYTIIIDDPVKVAEAMHTGIAKVRQYRQQHNDALYYNWNLHIEPTFQEPFDPTHENMANLHLSSELPAETLAANLRRVMSGIVAGNIKEEGISRIRQFGKFKLQGEADLMRRMDTLLDSFVKQTRMKLPGSHYEPCYEMIAE